MTGNYSVFLGLGCLFAVCAGAFGYLFFDSKMKLDVIRTRQLTPEQSEEIYNYWKLLRIHRSMFPASSKRRFFWASMVIFQIAILVQFIQAILQWHFDRLPK